MAREAGHKQQRHQRACIERHEGNVRIEEVAQGNAMTTLGNEIGTLLSLIDHLNVHLASGGRVGVAVCSGPLAASESMALSTEVFLAEELSLLSEMIQSS